MAKVVKKNINSFLSWYFINEKFFFFINKVLNLKLYSVTTLNRCWISIKTTVKYFFPLVFFLKFQTYCQFKCLSDIVVYDLLSKKFRFTVVYLLLSKVFFKRIKVIIKIKEFNSILSVRSLFNSSIWLEREIFDLFGIFVLLNNDLRRILTDYGFSSYPLRKDFPVTGYLELYYDDIEKRVVYFPLEISQISK